MCLSPILQPILFVPIDEYSKILLRMKIFYKILCQVFFQKEG